MGFSLDLSRLENHEYIKSNTEIRKALDDMEMIKSKNIYIKQDDKPLSARPPLRNNLINP